MQSADREAEQEDASKLIFGPEFAEVQCLTHTEVALMLAMSKRKKEQADIPLTQPFLKAMQHVKRYSSAPVAEPGMSETTYLRGQLENFSALDAEGTEMELQQFELASLANLMQADSVPEEALALIPSLKRFQEADIEQILEILRKYHTGSK